MTKLSDLPAVAAAEDSDLVYLVDASDVSEDPSGSSKQIPVSALRGTLTTVMAKVVIATDTDPASGDFVFSVPAGYERLIIQGLVRSDDADTDDSIYMYLNGDETNGNYYRQRASGSNGSSVTTHSASPFMATISGDNAPADAYAALTILLEKPGSSRRKVSVCTAGALERTNEMTAELCAMTWNNTDAVTSLKFVTGSGGNLLGTLTVYGEKQVSMGAL